MSMNNLFFNGLKSYSLEQTKVKSYRQTASIFENYQNLIQMVNKI